MKTYSDARNVLTGIIDSQEAVEVTLAYFTKSLVWLLLRHVNKRKTKEEQHRLLKEKEMFGEKEKKVKDTPASTLASEINHNQVMTINKINRGDGDFSLPPIRGGKRGLVEASPRPPSRESVRSRASSIHSFTDSIWSDDEHDKAKKSSLRHQKKVATVVSIGGDGARTSPLPQPTFTSLPPLPKKPSNTFNDSGNGNDLDELLSDFDFGLPAVDVTKSHIVPDVDHDGPPSRSSKMAKKPPGFSQKQSNRFSGVSGGNHIYKPVMNLAGSPDFKCQSSSLLR